MGSSRTTEPIALGVLFVHGIGAQRRGETLAQFGAPLYRWLEEWSRGLRLRWVHHGASQAAIRAWRDEHRPPDDPSARTAALEMLETLLETAPVSDDPTPLLEIAAQMGEETLAARAEVTDARRAVAADPEAPAHALLVIDRLRVDGAVERERWMLAESWWADTFSPPTFSDLALWGLGIVPWTIGSHFGARVRRVWRKRARVSAPGERLRWTADLLTAVLSLAGSLVLSLLTLALLAVLLLPALLPIPSLRRALASLQQQVASSLGDSYVLVTRPIEAASIVGQIRRDLDWLTSRGNCERVAVVAHSQGGALVHEAIRGQRPEKLELLLTFGSGLRKLEELREFLRAGRSFGRSAALTLIGLGCAAPALFSLGMAGLGFMSETPEPLDLAIVGLWSIVGTSLVLTGLWDLVSGLDARQLSRWSQLLGASGLQWVDYYASADPVPNGPLFDSGERPPDSVEVCNESSAVRDHNTYWLNQDEFVTGVVTALASTGGSARQLGLDSPTLEAIRKRRRWRVGALSAMRRIAGLSALAAILRHSAEWGSVLAWLLQELWRRIGSFLGIATNADRTIGVAELWSTIGTTALVVLAYLIARMVWKRWNEAEMLAAIRQLGSGERWEVLVILTLAVQLLVGFGVALGSNPISLPTFLVALFAPTLVLVFKKPSLPARQRATEKAQDADTPRSRAENLVRILGTLGVLGAVCFSWVLYGSWLVQGLQGLLRWLSGGWDPGFWPTAVGGAGILAALVALRLVTRRGHPPRTP